MGRFLSCIFFLRELEPETAYYAHLLRAVSYPFSVLHPVALSPAFPAMALSAVFALLPST